MSEEEGYAEDAKRDLLPKEYIAKIIYHLHFYDRVEPPDEHEIITLLVNKCRTDCGFLPNQFIVESVELA